MSVLFYILGILFFSLLIGSLLVLVSKDQSLNFKRVIISSLSLLFFVIMIVNLLNKDAFDLIYKFSVFGSYQNYQKVLIQFLRICTIASIFIVSLMPFSKSKNMGNLMVIFVLPITLLNILLFRVNIEVMMGVNNVNLDSPLVIAFAAQLIISLVMAIFVLFAKTNRVDFSNKWWVSILKTLPFIILLSIPISTYQMFYGYVGEELEGFTLLHRLALYLTIGLPIVLHIFLKDHEYEEKYLAMMFLSLSAFYHFYTLYQWPFSWSDIPIHLCNAAMVLIPLSLAFKSKKLFYFTYFFNTIGAILALAMPNTDGDMFRSSNIHFWYEHIAAFFIPILVVSIGVMPRPKFKEFKWAVIVFVVYFLTTLGLNAYITNFNPDIDYFFLNSDFFIEKFIWGRPLRENFVLVFYGGDQGFQFFKDIYIANANVSSFRAGQQLAYVIYPLYQTIIFIVFIFFTLILWVIYEYSYKVTDGLNELFTKKKMDKLDYLNFIKEMDGHPLDEPLNKGGVNMLKIMNLTKRYGSSDRKALDNFSLEVNAGEVFGFLGHNGAGKSTTIKAMVGILPITDGSVEIFGYDISKQPLEAKMQIGYVPDNHAVYERLTGREYVNYVADLYHVSKEDREKRFNKYLKLFDLERAIDNQIKTYSHGMKQKVTVIAALIHNPRLWVLDEPLTGLDPTSAYQVKEAMRLHANEGNIVFFSSHIIDVVEKICDRIAIIRQGKLVTVKDLKTMKEKGESLEKLYLEIVEGNKNAV